MKSLLVCLFLLLVVPVAFAQVEIGETIDGALGTAKEKVDEIAKNMDDDLLAIGAKKSVLGFINNLADKISFTAFHWAAFMLMFAGVINFGLQATLGKLRLLGRGSFSFSEMLSDLLAAAACLIGLIFVTQSASENSDFAGSAFLVLSAVGIGGLLGLLLYQKGISTELAALKSRRGE